MHYGVIPLNICYDVANLKNRVCLFAESFTLKSVAYIPARAGSKRLPGKNTKPLGGVSVLERVVHTLKGLRFLSHIYVSTDSPTTAELAQRAGAEPLALRKPELASDDATFMDLLKDDLPRYLTQAGLSPADANVLFVLPTAALLTEQVLLQAHQVYTQIGAPLLVAVQQYQISPYRALTMRSDGRVSAAFPQEINQRVQDMAPAFHDAGLFYFLNYQRIVEFGRNWFTLPEGIATFKVPTELAVDVDTLQDWEVLEEKFRALNGQGGAT